MKRFSRQSAPPRSLRAAWITAAVLALGIAAPAARAAEQYFAGDGSALSASKYGPNPTGTFTSAFVANNIIGFGVANGTGTGGSVTVGGFDALENFTLTAASGTISNASNGVVGITVAAGKVLDFNTEAFTTSATAGYTFNGNGTGVLALAGGTYGGGFTLTSGTVILRGVSALGGSATNTLAINGGTIAGSATRDLTGKYGGGITVGGDFQLGILAANSPVNGAGTALVAADNYSLTFSNNIALGTATTRTITLGNKGNQTLGGVISGSSGLTFAAVSGAGSTVAGNGTIALTNTANTFTGAVNINGPEVTFAADGSLGNTANTVNIEGGRLTVTATTTITATRGIQVGSTAGSSISAKGSGTIITYNGVIGNLNGETGTFAKQGGGTLALGGVSTYSGDTSINNGTLQLTTANNRLPTGTSVSLGQAASANLGMFDLNGFSQQIAGLNSITGTNASTTAKNTVTSATAATLTLGGGGTYVYGDGTVANSGIITGALSINKTGTGTQTLGDVNTYTGSTSISNGTLLIASTGSINGSTAVSVSSPGALTLQSATALADAGTLSLTHGATLNLNAASGTSETIGSLILDGTTEPSGTYTASQLTAFDSGITFTSGFGETLTIAAVPEPATVLGGVLMVGALGWTLRRRAGRPLPV